MSKTIMKKIIGVGTESFEVILVKNSNFLYDCEISELKVSTVKEEIRENEKVMIREEKIRPYNDGSLAPSDVVALQKKIDTYLKKFSVSDALAEAPKSAKAKKGEMSRAIEVDLKFQVERWIDEKSEVREVPVMKELNKTTAKKVATLPFYFRPSGGMVTKSVQNFIKHKNQ